MLDRKRSDPRGGLFGRCVGTVSRWSIAPCIFVTLAAVGVACGSSTPLESTPVPELPTPTAAPVEDTEPTPAPVKDTEPPPVSTDDPTPTSVPKEDAEEQAETFRRMTFDYWETFNAYDADGVLEFLEEGYGREREEKIRGDIGRLKLFSVQLVVTEESPPSMVDEDEWEMYLTMKEPLGTRRIRMAFREVDGEWKITFSEEVK